jgi:hypothetical protein
MFEILSRAVRVLMCCHFSILNLFLNATVNVAAWSKNGG